MSDSDFESPFPDPSDDESEDGGQSVPSAVFVSTGVPVQVRVEAVADDRAPEGHILASYIGGRLVARCAMPEEAISRLLALDLFHDPVPLGLLAYEEEPGLQCRLIALVPSEALAESEGENEPWKASVPSYEAKMARESDEEDEDGATLAPILLGNIVRYAGDRKFPGDLAQEAVDVLIKIVSGGPLIDADRKAIDDLLDSL